MFNGWDRQPWLYTSCKYPDDLPCTSGPTQLTPATSKISRNFCLNKNYATTHTTHSGYCIDYDDGSSEYNATDNVLVHGGFKIRDGVNRSHSRNLVVGARLADPQAPHAPRPRRAATARPRATGPVPRRWPSRRACPQVAGFDSTLLEGNIAVASNGGFYACVGDAFGKGTTARNNTFFTPGNPALPFEQGCTGSGSTLSEWQRNGANYDGAPPPRALCVCCAPTLASALHNVPHFTSPPPRRAGGSKISADLTLDQLLAFAKERLRL
jgi:hypothetical protein